MSRSSIRPFGLAIGLLLAATCAASAQYAQYPYYPAPYSAGTMRGAPQYYPGDGADDYDFTPRARPRPVPQARRPAAAYGATPGGYGATPGTIPGDADPNYSTEGGTDSDIDFRQTTRAMVLDPTGQPAGTLTVNTGTRKLYLSLGGGRAVEYGIGVGRQGFSWKGEAVVGRKAYWPGLTPPKEMLQRRPDLPTHMEGGLENPLGARALYLFKGSKDTLFRIHGTNEPDTIGKAVSSGCIRMLNADVVDLYQRVSKGARVVVL